MSRSGSCCLLSGRGSYRRDEVGLFVSSKERHDNAVPLIPVGLILLALLNSYIDTMGELTCQGRLRSAIDGRGSSLKESTKEDASVISHKIEVIAVVEWEAAYRS